MLQVDDKSPLPLYIQVEEDIRKQIESGALPPGHRFLLERELASQYGVSPVTVKHALQRSRPGRAGDSHQAERYVRFAARRQGGGPQAADEDAGPDHSGDRGPFYLGDLQRLQRGSHARPATRYRF